MIKIYYIHTNNNNYALYSLLFPKVIREEWIPLADAALMKLDYLSGDVEIDSYNRKEFQETLL